MIPLLIQNTHKPILPIIFAFRSSLVSPKSANSYTNSITNIFQILALCLQVFPQKTLTLRFPKIEANSLHQINRISLFSSQRSSLTQEADLQETEDFIIREWDSKRGLGISWSTGKQTLIFFEVLLQSIALKVL